MDTIFISYSRDDIDTAEIIISNLRDIYGHERVWYDLNMEKQGGIEWPKEIMDQIKGCDIFIYLLSGESLASEWCVQEYREAKKLGKYIIPVQVRRKLERPDTKEILEEIRKLQIIDYWSPNHNGMVHLIATITNKPDPRSDDLQKNQSLWTLGDNPASIIDGSQQLTSQELAKLVDDHVKRIEGTKALSDEELSDVLLISQVILRHKNYADVVQNISLKTNLAKIAVKFIESETFTGSDKESVSSVLSLVGDVRFEEESYFSRDDALWAGLEAADIVFMGRSGLKVPLNERPLTVGRIPYSFSASIFLVTRGQFLRYLQESQTSHTELDECLSAHIFDETTLNHPIVCVTFLEAREYCSWLTSIMKNYFDVPSDYVARLPTEAEWEYMARGSGEQARKRILPWQETPNSKESLANYFANVNFATTCVGIYPQGRSLSRCLDVVGNCWEMTSSLKEPLPYSTETHETSETDSNSRIIRGGVDNRGDISVTKRQSIHPTDRLPTVGFRVVFGPNLDSQMMKVKFDYV